MEYEQWASKIENRSLFNSVGSDLRPEITSEQINTIMLLLPPE